MFVMFQLYSAALERYGAVSVLQTLSKIAFGLQHEDTKKQIKSSCIKDFQKNFVYQKTNNNS